MTNTGTLTSDADLSISSKNLQNTGTIQTDSNLNITTDNLLVGTLQGNNIVLAVQDTMTLSASDKLTAANNITLDTGVLTNKGQISAGNQLNIAAQTLTNENLISGKVTAVNANALNNKSKGKVSGQNGLALTFFNFINDGTVASGDNLTVAGTTLSNNNFIGALGSLAVDVTNTVTNTGTLTSDADLSITSKNLTNTGTIQTDSNLNIVTDKLLVGTMQGNNIVLGVQSAITLAANDKLSAANNITLDTAALMNKGHISVGNGLSIHAQTLTNENLISGKVTAINVTTFNNKINALVSGQTSLALTFVNFINDGTVASGDNLTVAGAALSNNNFIGALGSLVFDITNTITNTGTLTSDADLSITSKNLQNTGTIQTDSNLNITTDNLLVGTIQGNNIVLTVQDTITLTASDKLSAANNVTLDTGTLTNKGQISAGNGLNIAAQTLTNENLISGKVTAVNANTLNNKAAGKVNGQTHLNITANDITNDGTLASGEQLTIKSDITNNNLIFSMGDIVITGDVTNTNNIIALEDVSITGHTLNNGGVISAVNNMVLTGVIENNRLGEVSQYATTSEYSTGLGRPGDFDSKNGYGKSGKVEVTQTGARSTAKTTSYTATGDAGLILSGGDMTLTGEIINRYSTLSVGGDLFIAGTNLLHIAGQDKNDIISQAVEQTWTDKCLQGYAENGRYNCTEPGVFRLSDEIDVGSPTQRVTYTGTGLGAIIVAGNITGNLSGKVVEGEEAGIAAHKTTEDTSASGSKGNENNNHNTNASGSKGAVANNHNTSASGSKGNVDKGSNGQGVALSESDLREHDFAHSLEGIDREQVNSNNTEANKRIATDSESTGDYSQDKLALNRVGKAHGNNLEQAQGNIQFDEFGRVISTRQAGSAQAALEHHNETRPEFLSERAMLNNLDHIDTLGLTPEKTLKGMLDDKKGQQQYAQVASTPIQGASRAVSGGGVEVGRNIFLSDAQMQVLTQDLGYSEDVINQGRQTLYATLDSNNALFDDAQGATIVAGGKIDLSADQGITLAGGIKGQAGVSLTTLGSLEVADNTQIISDTLVSLDIGKDFINTLNIDSKDVSIDVAGTFSNVGTLTGESIAVMATGNLTNYGTIQGTQSVFVESAAAILNLKDITSGGLTQLIAGLDITNDQALIAGHNVYLKAGGDIINRTEYTQNTYVMANGDSQSLTQVAKASTIISHNNLTLDAGNDIDLQGSQLAARDNISIKAGNDVLLTAIENKNGHEKTFKGGHDIERSTTYEVVDMQAGNNITVIAGNNLESQGAQFNAGGDAALVAGNEMNLLAVTESHYSSEQTTKKSTFKKKVTSSESQHDTVQGTTVTAGGDLLLNALKNADGSLSTFKTGDVNIAAGNLSADGDGIIAGNNINIVSQNYHDYEVSQTRKKSFGGLKNKASLDAEHTLKAQSSDVNLGGTLSLISDDSVLIAGSDLNAGQDVNITAFNEVTISAVEETKNTESSRTSGGLFSGGKLYSMEKARNGQFDQTAKSANIAAQGNINIDAGSAKVIGSNLEAGGDVYARTDIGDIEILAATETSTSYSEYTKLEVDITDALDALKNPQEFIKEEDGKLKVTLASASYEDNQSKSSETTHKGSNLSANNSITLDSAGDVFVEGSNLAANVGSEQGSDNTDNPLSGVNLFAAGNVTVQETNNRYQSSSEQTTGEAELSVVGQNEYVETAKAIKGLADAKDQLKQAKRDYKTYKKERDGLAAQLTSLENSLANNEPGVSQNDIDQLSGLLKAVNSDEAYYQAGIALQATNLASKTTLLLKQTANMGTTAGFAGFNAGLELSIDASKTKSNEQGSYATASNISGNNINIVTGSGNNNQVNIQGSNLSANNGVTIITDTLNVTASQDTHRESTKEQSGNITITQTIGGVAGPSVNANLNQSESQSASVTYNNSQITGNNITLKTTGDANILGGNIHANDNLHTDIGGDLNLVSQQNTSSGSNHGIGISGGVGSDEGSINSVNAGINSSNGRYYTSETVQTSLTSGGNANVMVGGNTHLEGALLATIDENGQDSGKLNLSTESLSYSDLSNSHYDSNQSMGLSSNVGIGNAPATTDDPLANIDTKNQSSSMQYSNTSSTSLGKTLATLGEGDITIGGESQAGDSTGKSSDLLAGLNRDTQNTEKELYSVDRQQGNVDVTVDHRLLSEEGREVIAEDFKRSVEGAVAITREIKTWGDQAPENVQLLMPGIETYIESQILAGEDVDQIMAALNSDELTDAVNMLAPLIELSETNPELLKETMAVAKAINEDAPTFDENGREYVTINGTDKIPLKAEILDSLGIVNEALKAVSESDSTAVAAMLLTGVKGLPGMIVEAAVDAVVGDNIEEVKAYASDKISTWGTDKTSEDFYESLAEEQKFKDSDFHTNVDGGSELVVELAAVALVGKAVTNKGSKETSTSNDTKITQSSDKSTADKVDVNNGKVDTDGVGTDATQEGSKSLTTNSDNSVSGTRTVDANKETETYFRVEGGGSGSATSQHRITTNANGTININSGCSGQVCVSVGNSDHATYFLTNKRADGSVVVFEVDAKLHKEIMDNAIPQRPVPGIPRDPSAPKIVDPNQPGTALELPKVWDKLLEKNSSKARILSAEDYFKEFGE